ncbi:MAG: InlB B-repeat-containing protein [Clostridiales bacterium]|nr:InlB B-repeat-containing protein [Clostridiales bacterium]
MILSVVAFVVILLTALVSVSFAKWISEGSASVETSGSVGQFYVDYPRYAEGSGPKPYLKDNTFYLQVQKSDGMSDYYAMQDNNDNSAEKMLTNVYLTEGTVVDMYNGTTLDRIRNVKDGSTSFFDHPSYNTASTAKIKATGYYDFYYEYQYQTMYVSYKAYVSNSSQYDAFASDLGYTMGPFNIVYSNGTTRKMYFKFAEGATGDFADYNKFSIRVWTGSGDSTKNYYEYGGGPKSVKEFGYNLDNGQTIPTADYPMMIIAFGGNNSYNHQSIDLDLKNTYAKEAANFITLHNKDYGTPIYDGYASTARITAATPYITALTDISSTGKLHDDEVVREVNAQTSSADGKTTYTYNNYVCVSREGGKEETIAYVNFDVESLDGTDLSGVGVVSFSIKRTATDSFGAVVSGEVSNPFIYNDPTGKTLNDIKPKTSSEDDVVDTGHLLEDYLIDGTYIMLYFGSGSAQYYALDIEIETDIQAAFTLTATASNIDRRNRFEDGYGAPFGYYLGGEFNGIGMWEPRKASRLTAYHTKEDDVSLSYSDGGTPVDYKGPSYIDVSIEIELTSSNDTVKLYRLGSVGQYSGGEPTLWFIPRNIYKNYTGGAGSGNTSLFNQDMNIIIRNPGTYVIHFVGSVQYRDRDANGTVSKENGVFAYDRKTGEYISENKYGTVNKAEKITYDDGTFDRYVVLGNWNAVVDSLYVNRVEEGSISTITVTYDANGGTLNLDNNTEVVSWGARLNSDGLINEEPTPPIEGMRFLGWFDHPTEGTRYTDQTIVTVMESTLTLYAHYDTDGKNIVKFDANGGTLDGSTKNVLVSSGGSVPRPVDPSYDGEHVFGGWYSDSYCTRFWNFNIDKVNGTTTLYAKWHIKSELAKAWHVSVNGVLSEMSYHLSINDGTYKDEFMVDIALSVGDELRFFVDGDVPAFICENTNVVSKNEGENFGTSLVESMVELYFKASEDHFIGALAAIPYTNVTVTFELNGGTIDGSETYAQTVHAGSAVPQPNDPINGGHVFYGWYDETESLWSFDTTVTMDITLYAKWSSGVSTDGWYMRINDNVDLIPLANVFNRLDVISIVGNDYEDGAVGYTANIVCKNENRNILRQGDKIYIYQFNIKNSTVAVGEAGGILSGSSGGDYVTVSGNRNSVSTSVLVANKGGVVNIYIVATINLELNGGTLDGETTRIVRINSSTSEIVPTKSADNGGYVVFLGWFAESSYTTKLETITGNTTAYAKWSNEVSQWTWTVRINDNPELIPLENVAGWDDIREIFGGANNTPGVVGKAEVIIKADDRLYFYQANPSATWISVVNDSTVGIVRQDDGYVEYATVTVEQSGEYVLLFTSDSRLFIAAVVTYELNGGRLPDNTYSNQIIAVNSCARPFTPIYDGYDFEYWYKDNAETQFNFGTPITAKTTLYAKWVGATVTYTVTFNYNYDGRIETKSVEQGGTVEEPDISFRGEGVRFDGWYTDNGTFTDKFDFGTVINSNIPLYAKWVITVTFNYNCDKYADDTVEVVEGKPIDGDILSAKKNIARTGYTFDGWYMDSDFGTLWTDNQTVSVTDRDLYAKWTLITYTIHYSYENGASGNPENPGKYDVEKGEITLLAANPGTDRRFTYWSMGEGASDVVVVTKLYPELFEGIEGNEITLVANFVDEFTITFDGNGGTLNGKTKLKTDENGYLTDELPIAMLANYDFGNWWDSLTGGIQITTGTSGYKFTSSRTVYAHWNRKSGNFYISISGEEQWLGTMTNNSLEKSVTIPSNSELVVYNGASVIAPYYTVKPDGAYSYTDSTKIFTKTDSSYQSGNDTFTFILEYSAQKYSSTIRHSAWFTSTTAVTPTAGDYYLVGNFSGNNPTSSYKLGNVHVSAYRYNKTAFSLKKYDEYEVRYYKSSTEYISASSTKLDADTNRQIYACAYNDDTQLDVKTSAPAKSTKTFYLIGSFNSWTASDSNYRVTNSPDGTQYQVAIYLTSGATLKLFCADYGDKYQANFKNYSSFGSKDGDGNLKLSSSGTYAFYYKEGETYSGSNDWNPIYVARISTSNLT